MVVSMKLFYIIVVSRHGQRNWPFDRFFWDIDKNSMSQKSRIIWSLETMCLKKSNIWVEMTCETRKNVLRTSGTYLSRLQNRRIFDNFIKFWIFEKILPTFLPIFLPIKILLFNVFTHEQLKVLLLFLIITLIDTVTTAKSILKPQILNILHTNCKIEK